MRIAEVFLSFESIISTDWSTFK